jgi:hypothetical protein
LLGFGIMKKLKLNRKNMAKNVFRVLKRAFLEYWTVLLICLIWTWYQVENDVSEESLISTGIKAFSTSFFFLAWLSGQFFRIKKQQFVEDQFSSITKNLSGLLVKMEEQTKDLIGFATGGDSIGYFIPSFYVNTFNLSLGLMNESKYPVFDFAGYWVDIDDEDSLNNAGFLGSNQFNVGNVFPGQIAMDSLVFDLSKVDRFRVNIFASTRNGGMQQLIRVVKLDGVLKIAFKANSRNWEKIQIPEDFPGYDGNPDSVFK